MANGVALPASGIQVAQSAAQFKWDGHGFETGVGIAASGGGFRAMLFHTGAFLRLSELGILEQAKRISGVSGGSIATGFLATVWDGLARNGFKDVDVKERFVAPMLDFSRQKIDVVDALTGVLPWTSAAQQVSDSYDDHLFKKRTLQDLPDTPDFVFCSTNLQTGVLFRFTKRYAGDYVIGRSASPTWPLAQAVAASSAFPPVLSPMILEPGGAFKPWPSGAGPVPEAELGPFRQRVILTDGGVYDNNGLEPIVKRFSTLFASDGGAPFERTAVLNIDWISQLRRVFEVTQNQVRALRVRDLIKRLSDGNGVGDEAKIVAGQDDARMGAYWGIDTDPARLNPPDALACNPDKVHALAHVATRLSDLGEQTSKQLINWGYAICDRSVRSNYPKPPRTPKPDWPYADAKLD
jgi:NTE family protein